MANRKPLLFGDKAFDAERIESVRAIEQDWDWSYVPGYSEARRDNELRVKRGLKPIPIPRLQWVRVSSPDGRAVDHRQNINWRMLGYEACTADDLKSMGFNMPPTAYESPDGSIRREDLALAYVDAATAEKNRRDQEAKNAAFAGQPLSHTGEIYAEEYRDGRGTLDEAFTALSPRDER